MSDMASDHEDREEMLREQLRQAREELEEEKRANMAADAALRAQEAQESRRNHEETLTQLRDLAGTLREQREMHQECSSVARKADDEHRTEKGSEMATLRDMMMEVREAQKADEGHRKVKAVTARAVAAGRSRRTTLCYLHVKDLTRVVDVDAMLAEARRNNAEQRAAFTSLSDGKYELWAFEL